MSRVANEEAQVPSGDAPVLPRERSGISPEILAVATVAASIAYGALTMSLWFDTNDDPTMRAISIGLFNEGTPDPRIVYQSAFLGALFGQLARLRPEFDWYSGLQWCTCIAGFLTMNVLVLRRDRSLLGWGGAAAVTAAFLPPFLFNLQFVQTSFVCLMTGLVSLIDAMRRPATGLRAFVPAFCWMLAAPLFRNASLMAAELVLGAVVLLALGDRIARRDRAGLYRDASILGAFALGLVLIATAIRGLEHSIFYADRAWAEFVDNLSARPYVVENWPRWIGLERIGGALETSLGISPEQYWAMAAWIPISSEWYSVPSFARMAAVIRALDPSRESLAAVLFAHGELARSFLAQTPVASIGLGLIGLSSLLEAAIRPGERARLLGQGLFWIAVPAFLWLGISIAFRPPPSRVWLPLLGLAIWGSVICRAVLVREPEPWTTARARRDRLAFLAFGLGLFGPLPLHGEILRKVGRHEALHAARCESTEAHISALERIPREATIFLAPHVVHTECFARPFELRAYPEVLIERTLSFGWRTLTPPSHAALFSRGSDLFDRICARPDNAFVADPPTRAVVERYLARHRPGSTMVRYSEALPEAIRTCRSTGTPPE